MEENTGIVFISGAGLNGSLWDAIREKISNPVLTPDFPNRNSAANSNARLTFDDYVDKTVAEIRNWQTDSFVIAAHSIGACVGLKVAGQFKKELKGFVAIGSVVPKSGQSFISTLPFPQRLLLPVLLTLFGTRPPSKSIESDLCNDLTPEQTLKIVNQFTPEAKALYTTKIRYELPDTKRLYIKLTNDKSIPADLQDKMAVNLKATKVEILESGHLPMVSKSDELALILSAFMNELMQDKKSKVL